MKGKYFYRTINTVITATGTLLCIVSGFIPAPYGLLSDGTISLIQSLTGSQKAERFIVPVLLFIAATVIVAAGRYKLGSLIAVLGGSCIFALTDLSYIQSSMAFTGTLLNEFGIVIALSGVLLHAIGTPESKSLKAKNSKKTLDPFLEIKPGPEPETEVLGIRTGLQEEPESGAVVRSVRTGLQEEPELGAEVSSVQTGLQEEPESEAAVLGLRTGLPEETESANEPQKDNAPAEVSPAGNQVKYTQVLWPAEPEPDKLIEEAGEITEEAAQENNAPAEVTPAADQVKYTQVLWPAEAEPEELIEEVGEITEATAQEAAQEAAPLENTLVLDADFEDLLKNADGQTN